MLPEVAHAAAEQTAMIILGRRRVFSGAAVVVGSRARIGAGSVLTRTVVLPGARVPPRSHFSDVLVFGAGQVVST